MADISAIAIRYAEEVWNGQDLDAVDEIFSAGHVYHDTLLPDLPTGPEGVRQRRSIYLAAIPDGRVTLHRLLSQGEHVAADWTYTGTNTGEIMGMPPTGGTASIGGSHFFRFEGDRIAETWTYPDNLGLLQQLGLVTIGPAR
jgi:steroid delta-isomerase-like uncharacterized protein